MKLQTSSMYGETDSGKALTLPELISTLEAINRSLLNLGVDTDQCHIMTASGMVTDAKFLNYGTANVPKIFRNVLLSTNPCTGYRGLQVRDDFISPGVVVMDRKLPYAKGIHDE